MVFQVCIHEPSGQRVNGDVALRRIVFHLSVEWQEDAIKEGSVRVFCRRRASIGDLAQTSRSYAMHARKSENRKS